MLRITDKTFRYTPSYSTDIRKSFRKMEQAGRAAAASNKVTGAANASSVVPMVARRSVPKA